MNNLMQNDGRLTATYETKVAAMACSLIDQYAAKFVNKSSKGCDYPDGYKHESMLEEAHKMDNPKQIEPSTHFLENRAEAARDSKRAKLSAAMKGELSSIQLIIPSKYHRSLGPGRDGLCYS
jgi:hypothetical protein